jgi:hypothetical protein
MVTGYVWLGPWVIALQIADPSCRQRGRSTETRLQLSDSNVLAGSNLVTSSRVGSTPRHTDWLTVSRKVTSTSIVLQASMLFQVTDLLRMFIMYFNITNFISKISEVIITLLLRESLLLLIHLICPGHAFCGRCWPWNSACPYKEQCADCINMRFYISDPNRRVTSYIIFRETSHGMF